VVTSTPLRHHNWPRELEAALASVRDAALLARDLRRRTELEVLRKLDTSPVTVADFAVQALVAGDLFAAYPDDALVAEEDFSSPRAMSSDRLMLQILEEIRPYRPRMDMTRLRLAIDRGGGSPASRFWTLDPIDGTEGFISGGQYAVALALVVRGRPAIAVLGCPALSLTAEGTAPEDTGALLYATCGRGAFHMPLTTPGEPRMLSVSDVRDVRAASVIRSRASHHIDLEAFDDIVEALGTRVPPQAMDGQAKHAMIAAGRADVMLRLPATRIFRDKIWDHAAGTLIVEEAGGCVTDLAGRPLDFSTGRVLSHNEGVVASNGRLHSAVLEAVRRTRVG
jgi:3'(2'), 5'-bisphosphate nucleotidase